MSSSIYSPQVFVSLPLHLTPANSTFLQADTQSSTLSHSRCPNHLNLPRLATLYTRKTVQIYTALSILPRHSTHPSHHHSFRPLQAMQILGLHRSCFSPTYISTYFGHELCISFPSCGLMHHGLHSYIDFSLLYCKDSFDVFPDN